MLEERIRVPVSFVIPTRDRFARLAKTLSSLSAQSATPQEVIIVDASRDPFSETQEAKLFVQTFERFLCVKADQVGAAAQRNQGVSLAGTQFIAFCDDDVDFQPHCLRKLLNALEEDPTLGGVNATIVNQRYQSPGAVSRILFTFLNGRAEESFAGRVIGPAVNLLPEERDDLSEIVPVDWLNLGCTIYRREALPSPPFDSVFTGSSMMEDLTLSLRVGRKWKLANVRTARIFHDSQSGEHKWSATDLARMELVNRHYVMTRILERSRAMDYFRLFVWELFQLAVCALRGSMRNKFWAMVRGKGQGLRAILSA